MFCDTRPEKFGRNQHPARKVWHPVNPCVITCDGRAIDMVAIYQKAGFSALPPQLTITGDLLRTYGDVREGYEVVRTNDHKPIGRQEAVPVADGDAFESIPRGRY